MGGPVVLKALRKRIEDRQYRSALGFYNERERDEVILEVKDDGSSLYVEIPTHLRNRAEIVVGSRLKGKIKAIYRRGGREKVRVGRPFEWEVEGYWNELHLSPDDVSALSIAAGDYLELVFEKVINYGEESPL